MWLVEDTQRIEPKVLVKRHTGIIVAMFHDPSKSQERLLKPFKDMLTCSPKLCTFFSAQVCSWKTSAGSPCSLCSWWYPLDSHFLMFLRMLSCRWQLSWTRELQNEAVSFEVECVGVCGFVCGASCEGGAAASVPVPGPRPWDG